MLKTSDSWIWGAVSGELFVGCVCTPLTPSKNYFTNVRFSSIIWGILFCASGEHQMLREFEKLFIFFVTILVMIDNFIVAFQVLLI